MIFNYLKACLKELKKIKFIVFSGHEQEYGLTRKNTGSYQKFGLKKFCIAPK